MLMEVNMVSLKQDGVGRNPIGWDSNKFIDRPSLSFAIHKVIKSYSLNVFISKMEILITTSRGFVENNKTTTETADHMNVLVQCRHIVGAQSVLILTLSPSVLVSIG